MCSSDLSNRVVLIAAPAQPDVALPTQADLLGVFARARSAVMTAYVDSVTDAPLIATPPTPGRITAERTLPETGVVEWTLSNGARMLVKPSDFKADEVLFAARSPGGTSLVADGDDLHAGFGAYAVADGGLGDRKSTRLNSSH